MFLSFTLLKQHQYYQFMFIPLSQGELCFICLLTSSVNGRQPTPCFGTRFLMGWKDFRGYLYLASWPHLIPSLSGCSIWASALNWQSLFSSSCLLCALEWLIKFHNSVLRGGIHCTVCVSDILGWKICPWRFVLTLVNKA